MPFDGTEVYDGHPLAKLGAVERLLATEQQWCKGRLRDAHGRHCLVGAIEAVGGRQVLQKVVLQAAREVSGKRYWRIEFFNDDPRTTHADVLQVLRRARENMIAGMLSEYDRKPAYRRWLSIVRGAVSRRATWAAQPVSECETRSFYLGTNLATEDTSRNDHIRVLELQE
ncbi:MAG TPA: hypothetical protein VE687_15365 [Stellaceae bacterium]|jgi:hypothetical protein|nr:hypothetical protein [Stellaceae bacterium]